MAAFSSLKHNFGQVFIFVSGILMTTGGILHALAGWPALSEALRQEGTSEALRLTIAIGWALGGSAMLAMGLMTLLLYSQLRSLRPAAHAHGIIIGLFFLLFGTGASAWSFPNAHFLFFMAVGALLLVGLWMTRKEV